MTNQEKLIRNLELFEYSYSQKENIVTIDNLKPLIIYVIFKNNKVEISSKLKSWNFLTGMIEMNFENVLNYLKKMAILSISIMFFLFILFMNKSYEINNNTTLFFILILFFIKQFIMLTYLNFRIKYETIKTILINWLK